MRYHYPHTIENGHGEVLTFIRHVPDEDGGWLDIENEVKPGAGPPMHVHHLQDESLTVVSGRIGTQVQGEEPKYFGPGESVTFYLGVSHRFWNAGQEKLVCRGWVRPANNLEYFLTEMYKSLQSNPAGEPRKFDGAFLLHRYRSEFSMPEIPPFVVRFLFPVTYMIGRLTGKYRKFHDAPPPLGIQAVPQTVTRNSI